MPHWLSLIAAVLAGVVAAGTAFYIVGRRLISRAATVAATERERLLEEARQRLTLAAKEELIQAREGLERDLSRRRLDLDGRETTLQQHAAAHQERDRELERRDQKLLDRERALAGREQDARTRLEQIAGLSAQEAKEELMRRLEEEARSEAAALVRDIREQARKTSEREAKKIVALAIQRIAVEHTAESTVAAVALPNDDMKGRIIGREGRNIRAFEAATGVDVIIDDTPDTVVISCFDPVRRAVGKLALERLIADGRIHPGRIEEIVGKVQEEIEAGIVEAGEAAIYETGIRGMHPELVRLVGRMKYRTSYGQNILDHSKEVAWLAGMMAGELRLDTQLAKRGGLLHDVGKVLTHEHDGTHVQLGIEMATKYGEHPIDRRGEGVRDPGRPRGARGGVAHRHRRRRGERPRGAHRAPHRAGRAVSGADQGGGGPRDTGGERCQVARNSSTARRSVGRCGVSSRRRSPPSRPRA